MIVRVVQVVVAAATLAVAAIAYGADPTATGVLTVAEAGTDFEALPTTAPIGLPIEPTPTPLGIPAAVGPGDPAPTATVVAAPTPTPAVDDDVVAPEPVVAAPTSAAPPPVAEAVDDDTPADREVTATPTQIPTAMPAPDPGPQPEPSIDESASPTPEPVERVVTDVGHRPMGQASTVGLVLPAASIEVIGFHEAGHPGSQAINAAGTGVRMMTLESRGRGTDARSAADIVVPPGQAIVAPVTGTVVAASGYILYCEHQDQLVYIEPDGLPGWQVRLFHLVGAAPAVGSRVVAGETVVADSARMLPFESQIDEFTAEPSWPHVHVEVVDTTVPDTRPPGPGCP